MKKILLAVALTSISLNGYAGSNSSCNAFHKSIALKFVQETKNAIAKYGPLTFFKLNPHDPTYNYEEINVDHVSEKYNRQLKGHEIFINHQKIEDARWYFANLYYGYKLIGDNFFQCELSNHSVLASVQYDLNQWKNSRYAYLHFKNKYSTFIAQYFKDTKVFLDELLSSVAKKRGWEIIHTQLIESPIYDNFKYGTTQYTMERLQEDRGFIYVLNQYYVYEVSFIDEKGEHVTLTSDKVLKVFKALSSLERSDFFYLDELYASYNEFFSLLKEKNSEKTVLDLTKEGISNVGLEGLRKFKEYYPNEEKAQEIATTRFKMDPSISGEGRDAYIISLHQREYLMYISGMAALKKTN